jgi:hypothetical protein
MKHATSRELYNYWQRLRGGRPAPRRSEVEPSDIRTILADTFILEASSRDAFQIRLAGTRWCALHGREMKGEDFLDLWSAGDRNAIATLATAVSTDAAGAVISIEARNERGRSLACELMLLPLRHTGPDYDRILGSCAAFERPYWLANEPIVRQSLTSLRLLWPDEQPHFMRRQVGAPGPVAPIPLPVPTGRRWGHLTVLDGGKT